MGHYAAEMRCTVCRGSECSCVPSTPPIDETKVFVINESRLKVITLAEYRVEYRALRSGGKNTWMAQAERLHGEHIAIMLREKFQSRGAAEHSLANELTASMEHLRQRMTLVEEALRELQTKLEG